MTDDRERLAAWVELLRVLDADLVRREAQAREEHWSAEELAGLRVERDKLASEHNHLADAYDTGAAERDRAGLGRDVRASERDARRRSEHDDLDAGFPDRSLSGVDRDGAAGDRAEAHADRRRARAARDRAAEDRDRGPRKTGTELPRIGRARRRTATRQRGRLRGPQTKSRVCARRSRRGPSSGRRRACSCSGTASAPIERSPCSFTCPRRRM